MSDPTLLTQRIVEFYEKLSSWEHSVVRDQGLTLPQVHALEILGTHKALRMKELADKMGVTTGTLTVLADRLVKADMIQRKPHERDRRSILVELTEKGQAVFEEHDALHHQLTRDITVSLSEEECEQFSSLLEKINREF